MTWFSNFFRTERKKTISLGERTRRNLISLLEGLIHAKVKFKELFYMMSYDQHD